MARNEPRRHHYLPQFYLQAFAEDGMLWVFDREKREYRRQSPLNTAVQKDYYTAVDQAGALNRNLERILADIEGKASQAISLADADRELMDENRSALAVFCALLKVRTPNFEKTVAEAGDQLFKKIMKSTVDSEDRAAAMIADYEGATGKALPLSPRDLLDFIQREAFRMEPHRNATLAMMIEFSAEFALLLVQMNWVFAHSPDRTSFTTSDVPFGIIPPKDWDSRGWRGVGLVTPGAVKYVPLTPRTTLLMFDRGDILTHPDRLVGTG